jgi:hypothetical protein
VFQISITQGIKIRQKKSFAASLAWLKSPCLVVRIVDLLSCCSHGAVSLFSNCQFHRFPTSLEWKNTHLSTRLHIIAKHARRRSVVVEALGSLLLLVVVDVDDVKGVDVAGEVAEDGQGNVDEEVGAAACYDVDAYGWHC